MIILQLLLAPLVPAAMILCLFMPVILTVITIVRYANFDANDRVRLYVNLAVAGLFFLSSLAVNYFWLMLVLGADPFSKSVSQMTLFLYLCVALGIGYGIERLLKRCAPRQLCRI